MDDTARPGNSELSEQASGPEAAENDSPAPDHAEETLADQMDNVVPTYACRTATVVGLGGSAGSLAALKVFFQQMPANTGMSFVVVTHLSPDHESLMAEILQKSTAMRVAQVTKRTPIAADHVYVIPPTRHLRMMDGHLELTEIEVQRGRRMAVDLFFRTLADTHGPHAIGIVLSGADSDGSIGLKRIKERGGLTIAQLPNEAEQDGMPVAAIATGMVDWILPVEDMPEKLMGYHALETAIRLPPEDPPPELSVSAAVDGEESALREVLTLLRQKTHRDFACYKRATILRRLARRMQVNGQATIPAYLSFLRTHEGEAQALLQDLLISVTNFFRDRDAFDALEGEIPRLFEGKTTGDHVRVWSAGCATGEEAYSLAILLNEHARTLESPPSIQVFATDLDEKALHQARVGVYTEAITTDVSESRLRKFFVREDGGFRVATGLREQVLFCVHDLFRDAPFSRLDLISCRNLFIYVDRETQKRTLEVFHFALRPHGRLFMGTAESMEDVSSLFTPINKKFRTYARSSVERPAPAQLAARPAFLPPAATGATAFPGVLPRVSAPPRHLDFRKLSDKGKAESSWREVHFEFLEGLVPASVLINGRHEIVHLSRNAGEWLEVSGGEPTAEILEMVPLEIRVPLRTALFRVAQDGGTVEIPGLRVEQPGRLPRNLNLRVRSLPQVSGFFLVVFDEERPGTAPDTLRIRPEEEQWTVRQLEEELRMTRQQLRETEERHGTSQKELRAGNEELQSINEELRSAGEELETSKEELQSVNEELHTVNAEMKARVVELAAANSDLNNFISATNIATVFLDRDLRIKRYTPEAVALFNFIPGDLGRPLSDLTPRLEFPDLTGLALRVLRRLVPEEFEVRALENWYLARLQPYRTQKDYIEGIVLTFVDITTRKRAEQALSASNEHLRLIIENAREYAIFTMNRERIVTSWNAGAERLLGFMAAEIMGHSADVIFTPQDRAAGAPEAEAEEALTQGRAADERFHMRRDGTGFWGSGAMMAMHDAEGNVVGLLKILRDQTEQRRTLDDLKNARNDLENAMRAKDHFLAILSHELRTPLGPVLMGLDVLLESPPEQPLAELRGELEMMRKYVNVETQLIDELLDTARIARGKLELSFIELDAHATINDACVVCAGEIEEKRVSVSINLQAAKFEVMGDEVRLKQVFWNLLRNAVKFTPPGGHIKLRTFNTETELVVCVEDDGIGMDPELTEKIFQPFAQADPSVTRQFGGLGLGLSISRSIVEAHGGHMTCHSDGPGKGCLFEVRLPLKS